MLFGITKIVCESSLNLKTIPGAASCHEQERLGRPLREFLLPVLNVMNSWLDWDLIEGTDLVISSLYSSFVDGKFWDSGDWTSHSGSFKLTELSSTESMFNNIWWM